ncbi:hypothetical protein [Nitrococcus mobilis]|uniref:Uncharacterized protein n=1 Tax=Nitrococcus mobilis Nb-231 TaxID=314278 RepID=A4BR99_9GAMM|nr:hypothetical protein [Nitrococcus mobilis]EAR21721.1 hypothetical protein NB231_03290 [Nitrococcus mobilis Nb-231]EAR21731.1 hypothetical protein NB231_03340 [Nitrococcus mobilis Nb-231]
MASIMIRDLSMTETLDRQASLHVKGGWYGGYLMPHLRYPSSISKKFTNQIQVAKVNNTAVGIGGPNTFNLNGVIVQSQSA